MSTTSMSNLLTGKVLVNHKNKVFLANDVIANSKIIVLYFSGLWCKTYPNLLPQLLEIYEEGKKRESSLEIISIPCDANTLDRFENFRKQGKWYCVVSGDILGEELKWAYNITHVPSIIVIASDGTVITRRGVREILDYGLNVLVTWD